MASFSRPSVSDDNPFSEALFRTLKYRPGRPRASRQRGSGWDDSYAGTTVSTVTAR